MNSSKITGFRIKPSNENKSNDNATFGSKEAKIILAYSNNVIDIKFHEIIQQSAADQVQSHQIQVVSPILCKTAQYKGEEAFKECVEELCFKIEQIYGEKFSCHQEYSKGSCSVKIL